VVALIEFLLSLLPARPQRRRTLAEARDHLIRLDWAHEDALRMEAYARHFARRFAEERFRVAIQHAEWLRADERAAGEPARANVYWRR